MVRLKFKKHIRKESRAEVNRLAKEYGIDDTGGQLLLQSFADADTTERNGQDKINKEGMTCMDRFGQVKAHPLLCVIRDARAQKLMILKQLNLDLEPLRDGVGRPPGNVR
jgi:phage terminase small subunit